MINPKSIFLYLLYTAIGFALMSCGSQPVQQTTLADIDTTNVRQSVEKKAQVKKSKTQIKNAYYDYLKDASKDDEFRLLAATRIAEIELENAGANVLEADESQTEAEYEERVRGTIEILKKALKDFPDASGNDHTMYQLAKAYGQVGEVEKANSTLRTMASQYPNTPYFAEAKFWIAEAAFIRQNYVDAELAYTEVLNAQKNQNFVEKSLFKRGWSRFKQEQYEAALTDYYAAVERHKFKEYDALPGSEKELSDEYFRAIGLAFTYLGGASATNAYFSSRPNTAHAYRTYDVVSTLLLKQERYTDAVDTLQAYIDRNPTKEKVVTANLQILKIWKTADFFNRFVAAFNTLYETYHTRAAVWQKTNNISDQEKVQLNEALRTNAVLLANFYHNRYNKKANQTDWESANLWYERYLDGYQAYARQDKIYPLYAELLNKAGQSQKAFTYFELAAFDGDIILDKESAYATVYLSSRLVDSEPPNNRSKWLEKHLTYATLYGQLYPRESHTPDVIKRAVELAFNNQEFERAIEIANRLPDIASINTHQQVGLLKAQAHFNLDQFEEAEVIYQDLLVDAQLDKKLRIDLSNKLALSIYKQAEVFQAAGQFIPASQQFLRVYQWVPESELAPTAMYDAIAVFMNHNMWNDAIDYLNLFAKRFPKHPLSAEVGKKLSVAYLNADRSLEAAKEFEKLATIVSNQEERMAALWQAAELYLKKDDLSSALRAYKDYANQYPRPYTTNMEAMHNIAEIYRKVGDQEKRIFWLDKITNSDKKAVKSSKTERTQFIAASAAFAMAEIRHNDFSNIRLVNPLAKSLKRKKEAMQASIVFYGQATIYGNKEFVTQSTYQIGSIYRQFSKSLLSSERPNNLSMDELDEYNILLEDQAFPFEDKAIEFLEVNMARIAAGYFDPWIQRSLVELAELFPTRYNRVGKLETYVERL